jgi:predicted lipoprotein
METTNNLIGSNRDLNINKMYGRNHQFVDAVYELVMNAMDEEFDQQMLSLWEVITILLLSKIAAKEFVWIILFWVQNRGEGVNSVTMVLE